MPELNSESPLVYLIAGEPSGDLLGSGLIDGIRKVCPGARFMGVGGPAMQRRGLDSLFPMGDLSVMGIAEVLPRLRLLLRRIRETASHVKKIRPDIVVTIDSPDFSFRVARRLKGETIPLVHYVAPTVWAWRPKRAAKVAGLYDHLLALFPFEPPYFEREGLPTTFVGHPVISSKAGNGDRFRTRHNIDRETPVLCILPGSRWSEVSRLLPVFLKTLNQLRVQFPLLHAVMPTVPHLEQQVRRVAGETSNISVIVGREQKADAFAASKAALAASGTVALELAMARVPSVIGYRLNAVTAMLARRLVRTQHVSLVNILLAGEVMPERLQERCTPEELSAKLAPLLSPGMERNQQLAAFDQVSRLLTPPEGTPDDIAAREVLRIAGEGKQRK